MADTGELLVIAKQLVEYAFYTTMNEFVTSFYGPNAYKINIGTLGEYNDEGGTYWSIDYIEVTDKNDKEVPLDLDNDWWKMALENPENKRYTSDPPTLEELKASYGNETEDCENDWGFLNNCCYGIKDVEDLCGDLANFNYVRERGPDINMLVGELPSLSFTTITANGSEIEIT